ncbi:MAG: hypothetical protein LUH09_01590 [Clostridiales bacterium]|nr:hypothetical protein [Clostridiales bacterium]
MRVRLAILDGDKNYLNRIVSVFTTKYADSLQVYSYSDYQTAVKALESIRAHIFLVSASIEVDPGSLPAHCSLAYFVDMPGIAMYKGYPAVCKFQKLDLIYKQVLNLYTEMGGNESQAIGGGGRSRTTFYMSPAGGVGTSTMAAANARYYTLLGRKTLFLSFDPYDTVENYFQADGNFNFKHVIRAVKGKKNNLALKLKSYVQQDANGVYFFATAPLPLDVLELSLSDRRSLLSELAGCGDYDEIVADVPFDLSPASMELYRSASSVVVVSDGEESANAKIIRAYEATEALEKSGMPSLSNQVYLAYNRFSEQTGKVIDGLDWRNVGGIRQYNGLRKDQLIGKMAQTGVFDKIN